MRLFMLEQTRKAPVLRLWQCLQPETKYSTLIPTGLESFRWGSVAALSAPRVAAQKVCNLNLVRAHKAEFAILNVNVVAAGEYRTGCDGASFRDSQCETCNTSACQRGYFRSTCDGMGSIDSQCIPCTPIA